MRVITKQGQVFGFEGPQGISFGVWRDVTVAEIMLTSDEALVVAEGILRTELKRATPTVREAFLKTVEELSK